MTSRPSDQGLRKGLGAYYSPVALVEPIARWAIRNREDTVMDPSCGDGVFLHSAARELLRLGGEPGRIADQLHGFDVNHRAVNRFKDELHNRAYEASALMGPWRL